MKRFRFRLGTLEKVRMRNRRQAQGRLAEAARHSHRLREDVLHHEQTLSAFEEASPLHDNDPDSAPTGSDWKIWADLRDRERSALRRSSLAEQAAVDALGSAQEQYQDASREHRLLTRLREKRHRRWQQEVDAEETRFLSEIHLQRLVAQRSDEAGD